MSVEGSEMSRRRCSSPEASGASAHLLHLDDILVDIFVRLPRQPSSLIRAAAVCKRWRGLLTDSRFLCLFYAHHRKPPLLGVFRYQENIVFSPIAGHPADRIAPDRFNCIVPPESFPFRCYSGRRDIDLLACRHGRVLFIDRPAQQVVVCDPITGSQCRVAVPTGFNRTPVNGAVLCANDDHGHVHGGCHSCPFKVILVSTQGDTSRPIVCVYSSRTGTWGDLISTTDTCVLHDAAIPGILVGNAIYWLTLIGMLQFDLDTQSLAMISVPPSTNEFGLGSRQIIRAEDGAVGLAILSYPSLQIWKSKVNCHGATTWSLWKTVEMDLLVGTPMIGMGIIVGYDEDNDDIFVHVASFVYMVQLKSMACVRLYETTYIYNCHPFSSFYTPGIAINGGSNGAEMMNET